MCVCMYVCMYVGMYVGMYVCMYVSIDILCKTSHCHIRCWSLVLGSRAFGRVWDVEALKDLWRSQSLLGRALQIFASGFRDAWL